MDIFEWADDYNWSADYMDNTTGYIYKIQEAGKSGNKNRIKVVDYDGNIIGYVTRRS